jgi:hypothetical protein
MKSSKKKRIIFIRAIQETIKHYKGKTVKKRHFLDYANKVIKSYKGLNQHFINTSQLGHYLRPFKQVKSINYYYEL